MKKNPEVKVGILKSTITTNRLGKACPVEQ